MAIWTPPDHDDEAAGNPEFVAFRDRVFNAVEGYLDWVTAPLTIYQDGKAVDPRTGVFLQVDELRFLVTAAHTLRKCHEAGLDLHVLMPEKGLPPVPLTAEKFLTTLDPREDLCVIRLEAATIQALEGHYRFVRLDRMMNQYDKRHGDGLYVIYGFPRDMTRMEPDGVKRRDSWKYLTCLYGGEVSKGEEYDPDLHMLLLYERQSYTTDGVRVFPHGLSGCGIWYVGSPITHPLFSADDFELAGIQTAWHRKFEYAKGTWVNQVLRILWRYFPETHSPMKLHGMSF